ncbi:AMP-dependent synthetase [Streptomyces abikoensis]
MAAMELRPSVHADTFPRDHLPPAGEWPDLLLGPRDGALPDAPPGVLPAYPDRLNCGAELLDATIARLGPDRPAVHDGHGGLWTYGQLAANADRIAHTLTDDLGVVPGNRVLLRGPTSPWLAACWLAVMKAGAVAVTVLAAQRPHELATICDLARIRHALCDARSLDGLPTPEQGLHVTPYGGDTPGDLLRLAADKPPSYAAAATSADDVALIAFTSGTTGRPKGCMHFHRDVLAIADTFSAHVLRPAPGDVFAGSPPLGFTFGLGGLVVFPLRAGAATLLTEWRGPERLLADIRRHRVSVLFTAPTAYRSMLELLGERPGAHDLSSLRRCVSAGEHLPAELWHAWHRATGLRVINGIGATEMLHIFISAADDAIRPGTTGLPVPGYEARIVGPDGRPLPDGEPGLLAVRGPTGCRYLADERQRDYVRDGWNLTGDTYVREPTGHYRYVARADDMIISAGYNIAGPEVEEALLRHPGVLEAAVVGRPDARRGEIVVACVVLKDGVPPTPETAAELREFTKKEIVPYKCPREIEFLTALPRTPTGKLQRFRLRQGT